MSDQGVQDHDHGPGGKPDIGDGQEVDIVSLEADTGEEDQGPYQSPQDPDCGGGGPAPEPDPNGEGTEGRRIDVEIVGAELGQDDEDCEAVAEPDRDRGQDQVGQELAGVDGLDRRPSRPQSTRLTVLPPPLASATRSPEVPTGRYLE